MKIVVQRQTIDTDNIYSVSEVYKNDKYIIPGEYFYASVYCFDIESFNDKVLTVNISINDDVDNEQDKIIEQISVPGISVEALLEESKKVKAELILKNKKRIEKMRSEIIKIWSENQSEIPMFDIKNY